MKAKRAFGWMVLIIGLALCGKGIWMLFRPAMYEAVVEIKLQEDVVSGVTDGGVIPYDPYFIETELKTMEGEMVLSNVVQSLNLDAKWGRGNGKSLGMDETMELLRRRMNLDADHNTRIINIGFWDRDPNEAAQIANAIAAAYSDYRTDQHRRQMEAGIEKLEEDYRAEETNCVLLQSNMDRLRKELGIKDQTWDAELKDPETSMTNRPYWEAKHHLQDAMALHQLLAAHIQMDKADALIPRTALVTVVVPAAAPKVLVALNRWLGGVWLICGLALTGLGFYLLRNRITVTRTGP